ncbi:DsbE family thiol:disulfide interchange protein [Xanthobacter sp. TB0136]|uniref:DsbE family thiol:disulfide interchange protein n=1 Tax=Xanthobacter sp. TB0136 TaxID=3459177 RepID=UPI004039B756
MTSQIPSPAAPRPARSRSRLWVMAVPLVVFLALAGLFFSQLVGGGDPSRLPSALVGRAAPDVILPPLQGLMAHGQPVPGLDVAALKGKPALVNIWASWCAPCRQEHPLLMELAKDPRITLVGLNYKDTPENARRFLGQYGLPYAAVGVDPRGRAAIDWGVYGVPETFVLDREGRIVHKFVGPLTPEAVQGTLMPLLDKLEGAPRDAAAVAPETVR